MGSVGIKEAKRATAKQPPYPATNISAKIQVLYYSKTVVFSLEICSNNNLSYSTQPQKYLSVLKNQ